LRVLLVSPAYPPTFWSLEHTLPFVGRRWLLPPLGLLTVAALLPRDWELRLVDLAIGDELRDEELRAADAVMLSAMLVQRESLHAVLRRCRALGARTVVGGPYATAMPAALADADHLVLGEAEELVPELARDLAAGRARRVYREAGKPDLRRTPIPRFDLLDVRAYHYLPVQFSRGCPFLCEFCDIISLYGRRPRTKTPAQLLAELEAIRRLGFAGRIMFVDDNFIANQNEVRRLLPELAAWRRRTRAPFDFFTEASINLADDPELVGLMTAAGFAVVFVGIESPSKESLRETRKLQNLRRDLVEQVRSLRRRGLDVWGGFILGFDHDGPEIFERMIDFVQRSGIAYATVGMLTALPNTPLHERLRREGRLRPDAETGDMFALTNVVTRLPEPVLLRGYLRVLEALFAPEAYFERCREHLRHFEPAPGLARAATLADLAAVARSLWRQGVRGSYRLAYWRFLASVLFGAPRRLPLAIAQACAGHHFVTYTRETVAPRLRARLRELAAEPGERVGPPAAPDPALLAGAPAAAGRA
jgi:radical SAM superfamily enzyme YgiQ (UPF0313 family)